MCVAKSGPISRSVPASAVTIGRVSARFIFILNGDMAKEKEREAWTIVIDLFKELSYMYDKKHKDYFNRDKRQEAYKMLLQVYNEKVGKNMTLADFKKKLENMRTSYGRELKKVNASMQTRSGSSDVYVPSLWYYTLFAFLEETMEPCRTGSDTLDETQNFWLEFEESSSENMQVHDKEVPAMPIKPPPLKKQKMTFEKKQDMILESAKALMTQKEDDWEIIGRSIAVQMRDLSTHQQVIVHKIISDAIFYGKLGKLTAESQITLSPQHISPYPSLHIPQRCLRCSSQSSVINPSPQQSPQCIVPSPQPTPQYIVESSEPSSQPSP